MILLDTDACIELMRGNHLIIDKYKPHDDDVAISFMTVAEIYSGNSENLNAAWPGRTGCWPTPIS
jgi:predicted nucleic acid-binding protein